MTETPFSQRQRTTLTSIGLLLLIVAGIAGLLLPVANLAMPDRILAWHILQPGFVQGGIELAVLAVLLWKCFALRHAWASWAALAFIGLYLRRHHVDLPALMALLHLELLLALGAGIMRSTGRAPAQGLDDVLRPFLVGSAAWIALVIGLSLLGVGRPVDLKIAAGLLLIPVLIWGRTRPLCLRGWHALRMQRGVSLLVAVGILMVLLGWLARTNNITGYDPLWYSLRPQYVLAPEHSFFDETGLVSPVYYFPKLYELLIAPLSAFRDVSYPFAFGAGVLGLFGITVWRFGRALGVDRQLMLIGTLATITIPAIGNTALSTKSDVAASLLVLLGALWAWNAIRRHRLGELCWAFAALALASACKLIALPYAAALALGAALMVRFDGRDHSTRAWQKPDRLDWSVAGLASLAALVVHARTWWLAGVPTIGPEPLMSLWRWLGMDMREPIGTLSWLKAQNWPDVPAQIYEILFAPSDLPHIIVSWTGNVWLWLMLAGTGFWWIGRSRRRLSDALPAPMMALLTPVLLTGAFLAVGVGHMFRGGDGNYLIIPIACAMLAGLMFAGRTAKEWSAARAVLLAMLLASSAMQFTYSFANSHWGEPGTRRFDLNFKRSTFDSKHMRSAILSQAQVDDIAAALAGKPADYRVVGYVETGEVGFWLPTRYEPIEALAFSRPEYLMTAASFRRFLEIARIDALILPLGPEPALHDGPREVVAQLRGDPRVLSIRGQRYELLDLSALHAP